MESWTNLNNVVYSVIIGPNVRFMEHPFWPE